jgi:hypothetical protein
MGSLFQTTFLRQKVVFGAKTGHFFSLFEAYREGAGGGVKSRLTRLYEFKG